MSDEPFDQPTSIEVKCGNCRYRRSAPADVKNIGKKIPDICVRYPPTPIAIVLKRGGAEGIMYASQHPNVTENNMCGEWEPDAKTLSIVQSLNNTEQEGEDGPRTNRV